MSTMILAPAPVQQFTDSNGALLVGGRLFCYAAGTTTKQAAFTDAGGATALPNPIVLNVRGEVAASATGTSCGLWLDPTLSYKFVLAPANDSDPPTNPIWTADNVASPQSVILAALNAYEARLGGVPVGVMTAYGGATAPTGWLLCYGQAVSRTTYAALFATIGIAYGQGDGSSTFNIPDKRGRISIGADNMGGSAAGVVTQAVSNVNAAVIGAIGGDQHAQADTGLTATSTANSVVTDPGHLHNFIPISDGGTGAKAGGRNGFPEPAMQTATATTGIAVTTTVATTISTTLTGTAQNMPPVGVDNWIIFTGVAS
jgi:microcystin-dependent protein